MVSAVHLSGSTGNRKGQIPEGCSRIAKLDMTCQIGNDPFRIVICELVVPFYPAGSVAEVVDLRLCGRLGELATVNAEIPGEADFLDKRALLGRNHHPGTEASGAIQGRFRFAARTIQKGPAGDRPR